MSARVVTMQEIYYALVKWGAATSSIRLRDGDYALPDLAWLLGDFFAWYESDLARQGLADWAKDWDCDDFAWDFAHSAQKAHRRRQREDGVFNAEGCAVFECQLFVSQGGIFGQHDIVLVAQWENDALAFRAFEPQPKSALREYKLTPSEISSISLIR